MKRNLQLDFLRCSAVIMVMLNHIPVVNRSIVARAMAYIGKGGWIGVDLFFVLSGLLVSGLIMKEYQHYGDFHAGRFLIRRGFKIYPTYYIFLLFICCYYTITHRYIDWTEIWGQASFVINYFHHDNLNIHLWSVSVEEHFYFFLVILFCLLIRYKKVKLKYFAGIYLVLLLMGIGFRLYNYLYQDYNFLGDYARSHFRFDSLFLGVLLAYMAQYQPWRLQAIVNHRYKWLFFVLAIMFLSSNIFFGRKDHRLVSVINLAVNPICFAYIMLCLINFHNTRFLQAIKPMAYIGRYSYSIYLFHLFFIEMAEKLLWLGTVPFYLCCFAFSITGGILISKAVEYPFLKLRDRYFVSRSGKVIQ